MAPAEGAKRVSRAETSRHKERASPLTKAGGDTLCRGWAHNSPPLCWAGESAQLGYLGCHPAMPPGSPQLHPPTRRAFLHLCTSPDCSDASPATALRFCSSQRRFWEEREDLQHLHSQSCWGFKASIGAEVPRAAPDQDISVLSVALPCGRASPQPACASVSPLVAEVLLCLCRCAAKSGCVHLSQGAPKNWGAAVPTAPGSLSAGSCAARSSAFPLGHTTSRWPSRS